MKTYTLPMQQNRLVQTQVGPQLIPVTISARVILALLSAVTVATAFVLLSVWLTGVLAGNLIGAGTWGLGFIFLGLAADNRGRTSLLQLLTGVVLLGLALLQAIVSPDFIYISSAVVTVWIALTVFRLLQ